MRRTQSLAQNNAVVNKAQLGTEEINERKKSSKEIREMNEYQAEALNIVSPTKTRNNQKTNLNNNSNDRTKKYVGETSVFDIGDEEYSRNNY